MRIWKKFILFMGIVFIFSPYHFFSKDVSGPTTRSMNLITWTEFREWVPGKIQTVLLPVGSLEAHGVIPNGTDNIAPTAMGEKIAPRLNALIAPTLNYGVTPALQQYPGAVSISPDSYKGFLTDIIKELARNRFKNIVILNGHGGNTTLIKEVIASISGQTKARFLVINWWSLTEQETQDVFNQKGGHAGNNETAYVQAVVPKYIHPERYSREMAIPNPIGSAWFAYPFPASIGLYRAGEGYPSFDQKQADTYFKKVNDKVADTIENIIKKWDLAGL